MKVLKASFSKLANPLFYIPLSIFISGRIIYFIYDLNKSYGIWVFEYLYLIGGLIASVLTGYIVLRIYRKTNKTILLIIGMFLTFFVPGLLLYLFTRSERISLLEAEEAVGEGVMCYMMTFSIFHRQESVKLDKHKREKTREYALLIPNDILKKVKT